MFEESPTHKVEVSRLLTLQEQNTAAIVTLAQALLPTGGRMGRGRIIKATLDFLYDQRNTIQAALTMLGEGQIPF